MKKRADAMGALIRSGVDPDAAARIAGIDGVKFIGGRPITLKFDES